MSSCKSAFIYVSVTILLHSYAVQVYIYLKMTDTCQHSRNSYSLYTWTNVEMEICFFFYLILLQRKVNLCLSANQYTFRPKHLCCTVQQLSGQWDRSHHVRTEWNQCVVLTTQSSSQLISATDTQAYTMIGFNRNYRLHIFGYLDLRCNYLLTSKMLIYEVTTNT